MKNTNKGGKDKMKTITIDEFVNALDKCEESKREECVSNLWDCYHVCVACDIEGYV